MEINASLIDQHVRGIVKRLRAGLESIDQHSDEWFEHALNQMDDALKRLYGGEVISAHRLAGTFRRGDLFDHLGAPDSGSR
ncbi:MAG TPA: hypothetical protein VNM90_06440 [Haliangium sp.]|nr:hypothetical protein [Haliangium sp.]